MPIKSENREKYPPNWSAIRADILDRAGHKCEQCGLPNHVLIEKATRRVISDTEARRSGIYNPGSVRSDTVSMIKRLHWTRVILTIAHLDHNPENSDPTNLRALCQRCHNRYDARHRAETRDATASAAMHSKLEGNWWGWQLLMKLTDQKEDEDNGPG